MERANDCGGWGNVRVMACRDCCGGMERANDCGG
jgi:hypothetical protein